MDNSAIFPHELLALIVKLSDCRRTVATFRCVCKAYRWITLQYVTLKVGYSYNNYFTYIINGELILKCSAEVFNSNHDSVLYAIAREYSYFMDGNIPYATMSATGWFRSLPVRSEFLSSGLTASDGVIMYEYIIPPVNHSSHVKALLDNRVDHLTDTKHTVEVMLRYPVFGVMEILAPA